MTNTVQATPDVKYDVMIEVDGNLKDVNVLVKEMIWDVQAGMTAREKIYVMAALYGDNTLGEHEIISLQLHGRNGAWRVLNKLRQILNAPGNYALQRYIDAKTKLQIATEDVVMGLVDNARKSRERPCFWSKDQTKMNSL